MSSSEPEKSPSAKSSLRRGEPDPSVLARAGAAAGRGAPGDERARGSDFSATGVEVEPAVRVERDVAARGGPGVPGRRRVPGARAGAPGRGVRSRARRGRRRPAGAVAAGAGRCPAAGASRASRVDPTMYPRALRRRGRARSTA